jgi:hypothetical protein
MVYELSVRYVPDPDTDVLLDNGEIVSLDEYIRAEVAERQPAYIVGDHIGNGAFSVRFPSPKSRTDAIDFVNAVKPYLLAGIVQGHNCNHDTSGACEAPEALDEWNWTEDKI